MIDEIKGKVVVVTGASRGIGKAIVEKLAVHGAKLVLASRNIDSINEIGAGLDCQWLAQQTDVSDEQSVKNLMKATADHFGALDVLINNAGFVEPLGLQEITLEGWNTTLAVNLTGTFLCTREAVRGLMKRSGGKIVNIASTAGLTARPGWSAYAASKAAVISFSQAMADELRVYGIRVFCICPGRTATDLRRRLAPNEDPTTIMQPEAVVKVIEFCLTGAADVVEGQPILVRERT